MCLHELVFALIMAAQSYGSAALQASDGSRDSFLTARARPEDGILQPFNPASDGILIFSDGKTGTTSLQDTAGAMMEPPCHVAWGDSEGGGKSYRSVKCHKHQCAVDFLKNRLEGSRTWVITSNRNPFSMYPSAYFQHVGHWSQHKIDKATTDELLEDFHQHGAPHHPPRWYTDHVYEALGLNVTAHPFDFKKKLLQLHHTWNNRHLEVLIVRLEDSHEWEAILKPFFPKMRLQTSNKGSLKNYKAKYKEFMNVLQYTDREIDTFSQSESLNHFYTYEEKAAFIAGALDGSARRASSISEDFVLEQMEEDGRRC